MAMRLSHAASAWLGLASGAIRCNIDPLQKAALRLTVTQHGFGSVQKTEVGRPAGK